MTPALPAMSGRMLLLPQLLRSAQQIPLFNSSFADKPVAGIGLAVASSEGGGCVKLLEQFGEAFLAITIVLLATIIAIGVIVLIILDLLGS